MTIYKNWLLIIIKKHRAKNIKIHILKQGSV